MVSFGNKMAATTALIYLDRKIGIFVLVAMIASYLFMWLLLSILSTFYLSIFFFFAFRCNGINNGRKCILICMVILLLTNTWEYACISGDNLATLRFSLIKSNQAVEGNFDIVYEVTQPFVTQLRWPLNIAVSILMLDYYYWNLGNVYEPTRSWHSTLAPQHPIAPTGNCGCAVKIKS